MAAFAWKRGRAMAEPPPPLVLQSFRFNVRLVRSIPLPADATDASETPAPDTDQLGDGGFQECTGLELEADIKEHLEGGRNDAVVRRVGRVKLQPIVLKRGMFAPSTLPTSSGSEPGSDRVIPDLWVWLQNMVKGVLPVPRFDGIVEVRGPVGEQPRAIWRFVRGLPLKVVGPALNAKTGELAIEELHIAHEGLWLETR
jgi:phage tail-like protein